MLDPQTGASGATGDSIGHLTACLDGSDLQLRGLFMAPGPGVPNPPPAISNFGKSRSLHRCEESYAARANSILGGLHHEYHLAPAAA